MVYFLASVTFFLILFVSSEPKNNACTDYKSYLNPNNDPDCFYIPDNDDDLLSISRRHTGVGEAHDVTTEDGYILRIFRIPNKNPKGVVLFQNGASLDARHWFAQYNESVALLFWNAGYDVWLGNIRGCLFGKKHLKLKPNEKAFWNFSFHEMGYYDLHAMIEYIKKTTNRPKIFFVGFQQGGSAGLVYASLRPQEAKSIEAMVALAPMAYLKHTTSLLKYTLAPLAHFILKFHLDDIFNCYSFGSYYSWYMELSRELNRMIPFKKLAALLINLLGGGSPGQTDPRWINVFVDKLGSDIAWKVTDHYYQILFEPNGIFRMYDFGKKRNLKLYGSEKPSEYPLQNVQIPIFVMYAQNDTVVPVEDIETLYSKLTDDTKKFAKREVEGFGSFDFFLGKDRNEKAYKYILEFFNTFL